MQADLLKEALAGRAAKTALVIVTKLLDGSQSIVTFTETQGSLDLSAATLAEIRQRLTDDRSGRVAAVEGDLFVLALNPPKRLVLVGAVHISQSLVPMAQLAGYEVTIIDPRGAFATKDRFPGVRLTDAWPDEALENLAPDHRTAVITLTHDPKLDDPALSVALRSDVFYIGALGSKKTHNARRLRLEKAGFSEVEIGRIHGPVGLAIGAKSPAEIAVSILAQMTQALHRKPAA